MANLSAKIRLPAMVLTLLAISSSVQGTTINVRSQCSSPSPLTFCDQNNGSAVTCFVLNNGDSKLLDVGASWPAGIIWGFPGSNIDPVNGNNIKPQADVAEFTIGGANGLDSYDLSNVNAYNLPLQINPLDIAGGATPNGTFCGSPSCTIPDLTTFCQPPNKLTGDPADGCINTDGPGLVPTPGTEQFDNACPLPFSYSKDDSKLDNCPTGTNYEVVFCP